MSKLEDWQKRLLKERKKLGERIQKGRSYCEAVKAEGGEDKLLQDQLIHMQRYYDTLNTRIMALIPDNPQKIHESETL